MFDKYPRPALLFIIGLLVPMAAHAQSRLLHPPVDGYVVAYEASNATQSIREEIPEGETLESWTSMITIQRFANHPATPLQLVTSISNSVGRNCDRVAMGEPDAMEHQGLPAASFSATCYRPPEGGGVETFFMMAVQASDAVHVMQVAFKADVTSENIHVAVGLLRQAVICDQDCP